MQLIYPSSVNHIRWLFIVNDNDFSVPMLLHNFIRCCFHAFDAFVLKIYVQKHNWRCATEATFYFLLCLQVRDEVFDREEKLFRSLEKAVRLLVKNVQCYLQHTQVATNEHLGCSC